MVNQEEGAIIDLRGETPKGPPRTAPCLPYLSPHLPEKAQTSFQAVLHLLRAQTGQRKVDDVGWGEEAVGQEDPNSDRKQGPGTQKLRCTGHSWEIFPHLKALGSLRPSLPPSLYHRW